MDNECDENNSKSLLAYVFLMLTKTFQNLNGTLNLKNTLYVRFALLIPQTTIIKHICMTSHYPQQTIFPKDNQKTKTFHGKAAPSL